MSPPLKRKKKISTIREREDHHQTVLTGDLRDFVIPTEMGTIGNMVAELRDMTDTLLGRIDAPIDVGVSTMLEVADAFFGRASEMTMRIQQLEREGKVKRGDMLYKFRTGELRTFMDFAKRCADTGSRRITAEQMRIEMLKRGLETEGSDFGE